MSTPDRPWTVPVVVAEIPDDGAHVELVADAAVREAVAQLAGLRDLPRFEAKFDLRRSGDSVFVTGEVKAKAGQTCVVTLEPIESDVAEKVDLLYAPETEILEETEGSHTTGRREPPELLRDGIVDLGALAIEFLILGLDPYPRKPGAEFAQPQAPSGDAHPFAALAALKKPS